MNTARKYLHMLSMGLLAGFIELYITQTGHAAKKDKKKDPKQSNEEQERSLSKPGKTHG